MGRVRRLLLAYQASQQKARRHQNREASQQRRAGKTVADMVAWPQGMVERAAQLIAALATDQAFLADGKKSRLDVSPVLGPEVDKVVALITAAAPETVERLRKAIAPAP